MPLKSPVEIADRISRKRARAGVAGALVFLVAQGVRLLVESGSIAPRRTLLDLWAINALVLLALLVTGGGLLNRREIRALVNDDVSRVNYKLAAVAGFWVAMAVAMGLYLLPITAALTARDAVFVVVSPSITVAIVVFSWLELRAHRDG